MEDTKKTQSKHSKQTSVPVLANRRASYDGCRFSRILCTVSRVEAHSIDEVLNSFQRGEMGMEG